MVHYGDIFLYLAVSFLQYHCICGLAVLQSGPYNSFRFECPSKSGIEQIDIRTVQDRSRGAKGIMYTIICNKLQDVYPIDPQINLMEREDCNWSEARNVKFNRTCKPREYLAGMAKMSETSYATLCCKLRTREYNRCQRITYPPADFDFHNLMEFKKDNHFITEYIQQDSGAIQLNFCEFRMRSEDLIRQEQETSFNHLPSKEEEDKVTVTEPPLISFSTTIGGTKRYSPSINDVLRDFAGLDSSRLALPRHEYRNDDVLDKNKFDLQKWPSFPTPLSQNFNLRQADPYFSIQSRQKSSFGPRFLGGRERNSDNLVGIDRIKLSGRRRQRTNGKKFFPPENVINGRRVQFDRRQRSRAGGPALTSSNNFNQRPDPRTINGRAKDPRFPLFNPRIPVQLSPGDARPRPIKTTWFSRTSRPSADTTQDPITFDPQLQLTPNIEIESEGLMNKLHLSPTQDLDFQLDKSQEVVTHPAQSIRQVGTTTTTGPIYSRTWFQDPSNPPQVQPNLENEKPNFIKEQSQLDLNDDKSIVGGIENQFNQNVITSETGRGKSIPNSELLQSHLLDRKFDAGNFEVDSSEHTNQLQTDQHSNMRNLAPSKTTQTLFHESSTTTRPQTHPSTPEIRQSTRTPPEIRQFTRTPPEIRQSTRTPPEIRQSTRTPPEIRPSTRTPPQTRPPARTPPQTQNKFQTFPFTEASQTHPAIQSQKRFQIVENRPPRIFSPPIFLNSEEIRNHRRPPATPTFRPPPPIQVDVPNQPAGPLEHSQSKRFRQEHDESQGPAAHNQNTPRQGSQRYSEETQEKGKSFETKRGRLVKTPQRSKWDPSTARPSEPEYKKVWTDKDIVLEPFPSVTFIPTPQMNKIEKRKLEAFRRLERRFESSERDHYVYEDAESAGNLHTDGERRQYDFDDYTHSTDKTINPAPLLPRGGFQRLFVHSVDSPIRNKNIKIHNERKQHQDLQSNFRVSVPRSKSIRQTHNKWRGKSTRNDKGVGVLRKGGGAEGAGGGGVYVFHLGDGEGYKNWNDNPKFNDRTFKQDLRRCVIFGTC